jgi:acyl carrier protein
MESHEAIKKQIKALMVENLMLQVTADEIKDDQALFGPESLGLDSVDALQLVVALDKNFGLKVPNPAAAKEILSSVETMAAAVEKKLGESGVG